MSIIPQFVDEMDDFRQKWKNYSKNRTYIFSNHIYICVWISANNKGHYKIFCVNGNTGFKFESRIFYFIHLQNEEDYERKESRSA